MLDDDRRGETAIDRNQRGSADIVELERLLLRGEPYETFFASRGTAEWIEQPQAKRNEPWPAFDRRQQLPEGYGCPACVLVVCQCAIDTRGSCFLIPGHEMRKIDAARLFHAGEKVVDRRPFAVVTVEIEVARFAKADRAEKDGKHPNQFGALPVYGRRVEAYRSEEHTSELQSLMRLSYAVF